MKFKFIIPNEELKLLQLFLPFSPRCLFIIPNEELKHVPKDVDKIKSFKFIIPNEELKLADGEAIVDIVAIYNT